MLFPSGMARIQTQPEVLGTQSQADWMPTQKLSELSITQGSRIKLNSWTGQPYDERLHGENTVSRSLQNEIWNLPDWGTLLPNLYIIKKESVPDWPKFCWSGSMVQRLFWSLKSSDSQYCTIMGELWVSSVSILDKIGNLQWNCLAVLKPPILTVLFLATEAILSCRVNPSHYLALIPSESIQPLPSHNQWYLRAQLLHHATTPGKINTGPISGLQNSNPLYVVCW